MQKKVLRKRAQREAALECATIAKLKQNSAYQKNKRSMQIKEVENMHKIKQKL